MSAMSVTSAMRLKALNTEADARASALPRSQLAFMSVSAIPGSTAFTVMLRGRKMLRGDHVRRSSAPLAIE